MLSSFSFFRKSSKAFSLIEVLIVVSILAFVFALTINQFSKRDKKVKTVFEKIIRLNRRLTTVSKLHGKSYRWVIQLSKEGPDQYWVEKKQTSAKHRAPLNESLAPEKEEESGEKEEEPAGEFVLDDSFYSEPKSIASILDIVKIESASQGGEKTEGLFYIYYHPRGLAQETSIYFLRPDNQARWRFYLDPVIKEFKVIQEKENLVPGKRIE